MVDEIGGKWKGASEDKKDGDGKGDKAEEMDWSSGNEDEENNDAGNWLGCSL